MLISSIKIIVGGGVTGTWEERDREEGVGGGCIPPAQSTGRGYTQARGTSGID